MKVTELRSVFWLGGGSGAGKTTISRAVAGRLDLRIYHVDAYGYDHFSRMSQGLFPRTQAFDAKSYDERWLRAPEVLAEEFLAISRERMPLIIEDLTAIGPGPTIVVEGPQLLPELIAPLIDGPGNAVWLLPTSDFGRRGVAARGEVVPSSKEAEATENRYQRDVLVTQALAERAAELGLPFVAVEGQRTVSGTIDWLAQLLLDMSGGLERAGRGEQRALMRRQENQVIVRQLTAYWQALGVQTMPDAPDGPFSCECSTLGCDSELIMAVDEYLLRRHTGPLLAHRE